MTVVAPFMRSWSLSGLYHKMLLDYDFCALTMLVYAASKTSAYHLQPFNASPNNRIVEQDVEISVELEWTSTRKRYLCLLPQLVCFVNYGRS